MYKYVLTGGECVGKTSIILALDLSGERIIREAASDYQYVKRAEGNLFPLEDAGSEEAILRVHLDREFKLNKDVDRVFMDRSVIDSIVYARILKQELSDESLVLCNNMVYDAVFIVEPLLNHDVLAYSERERNHSQFVGNSMEMEYLLRGSNVIYVKENDLASRVKFILNEVEKHERRCFVK